MSGDEKAALFAMGSLLYLPAFLSNKAPNSDGESGSGRCVRYFGILFVCFGTTALRSLCDRCAIAVRLVCDCLVIALRSPCNRFAIAVPSLCNLCTTSV
jgi:hypothetical protein